MNLKNIIIEYLKKNEKNVNYGAQRRRPTYKSSSCIKLENESSWMKLIWLPSRSLQRERKVNIWWWCSAPNSDNGLNGDGHSPFAIPICWIELTVIVTLVYQRMHRVGWCRFCCRTIANHAIGPNLWTVSHESNRFDYLINRCKQKKQKNVEFGLSLDWNSESQGRVGDVCSGFYSLLVLIHIINLQNSQLFAIR